MSQTLPAFDMAVIKFVLIDCANCTMPFMVMERFQTDRRNDGETFFCPKGHKNFYNNQSEVEHLKRQLAQAENSAKFWRDYQGRTQKELSVKKGQLTKMKNRVANGVCPCCKRTFQNLLAHIKTQHPEFKSESEFAPFAGKRQSSSAIPLTTPEAVKKLNKKEFTARELFNFLQQNGVNRAAGSVQTSLWSMKADGRLSEVRGHGMNKVYRVMDAE